MYEEKFLRFALKL